MASTRNLRTKIADEIIGNVRRSFILLAIFALIATNLLAQQPETIRPDSVEPHNRATTEREADPLPRPSTKPVLNPEKKVKVTILMAAVCGIAIVGVGAIASILLWSRHLRRLARDMGSAQTTVGDDFWFLKPPKPIVADRDIADSHRPPHSSPSTEDES